MTFLLHVTFSESGFSRTITCSSAFLRGLWIISLAHQPVVVRIEDRVSA